jgi:hypothetical protein
MGVGSAINIPAMAAGEYERTFFPIVSATCASTSACLTESNSKSGAGIQASSSKGDGSIGQTTFKSTTSGAGKAGVRGQDLSTSGKFNWGVLGTSSKGAGVEGTSAQGNGVVAVSGGKAALFAQNPNFGEGVEAFSQGGNGTSSSTLNNSTDTGSGRSGVWGHDDSTDGGHLNVGVAASSTFGMGLQASSTAFVGADVVGGGSTGNEFPALSIVGNSGEAPLIAACDSHGSNPCDLPHALFSVDGTGGILTNSGIFASGDVDISGKYLVNGTCVAGCARTKDGGGKAVTRYVSTTSVPSVEDFGEAQLSGGQAHVRLTADFANVIDANAGYLVFITPEGDANVLFVSQKSATSFVVREGHGGQSNIAFQYRIVARPFGERGSRLPAVDLKSHSSVRVRHV